MQMTENTQSEVLLIYRGVEGGIFQCRLEMAGGKCNFRPQTKGRPRHTGRPAAGGLLTCDMLARTRESVG
jgi:hypothetical protein